MYAINTHISSVSADYAAIRYCDQLIFRNYAGATFPRTSAFMQQLQDMSCILNQLSNRTLLLLDELEKSKSKSK
jgi:DNA mismatch repair ATPase MutS